MTRWWTLALLAALIVVPAAAQGVNPESYQAGVANADTAATLYQDVLLLIPMRALALTDEQLTLVSGLNAEVLARAAALEELRGSLWVEHQGSFEAVIDARIRGARVDARAQRALDNAIARFSQARTSLADARVQAAGRLLAALSEEQQALVQSPDAAAARQALVQRLGGHESVGAFVAAGLDGLRDLMPEEYQMVVPSEAERMAEAIVGPDSPNLLAMAAEVLSILDEVSTWPPPRYQEQRQSLPAQINARLGFEAGAEAPVSWEDMLRLVSSERTAAAIALVRGPAEGEAR